MGATTGGALAAGVMLCAGCLSTSSYQTAKMLPQGASRIGASVNQYEGHADQNGEDQSHGVDAFDIMGSHGVTDTFEIGGKFTYINEEVNIFHLMVAPKLSLIPGELAVTAPTGVSFVGDYESGGMTQDTGGHFFETLPGLIGSHTFNPSVELTGALQVVWLINKDFDDSEFYAGANVGVRLRPPGAPWCVQPELGLTTPITHRDSDGAISYILQYGLAFHYDFGGTAASSASAGVGAGAAVTAPPPP